MLKPKKVLFSISLAVMFLLVFAGVANAVGEKEGIVTANLLNMRETPDLSSNILTKIPVDEKVEIIYEGSDWYKVRYDSYEGWVFNQYISILGESVSLAAVNANDVNIRSNPSLTSEVTDRMDTGEKVRVLDSLGDWYKISYQDKEGWVYKEYLSIIGEAITQGQINADDVNVRTEPSLHSDIITRLAVNKEVSIYGKSGDWYIVELDNKEFGWVYSQYVTIDGINASRGGEKIILREVDMEGVSSIQHQIVEYAKKFLGVKYVWGGSSPKGFDCSGFVMYVYKKFGVNLLHNAHLQSKSGTPVKREGLEPGDLVFFDTNGGHNYINHVGIYIGNGKFIHASSSRTGRYVKISELSGFYSRSYMTARRYIE